MAKSGGGGGRTARDRSKDPKKPGQHEDTMKAAPPVAVNADAANENARTMRAAKRRDSRA